jgi:hypothetical protein
MLCQYKNIFGEPQKGVHSFRIYDIAVVDVLFTILAAYILYKKYNYNFIYCLLILFILSIFCHWIFCVDTTVIKWLRLIVK